MTESKVQLICGDCLEVMKSMPDKSIDMILCDPPYGTTAIEWDKPLPLYDFMEIDGKILEFPFAVDYFLDLGMSKKQAIEIFNKEKKQGLWSNYGRITKDNAAILLFSAQPFTTDLINSNRKMFRYEIIWRKTTPSGFLNANKAPLRIHENIEVFYVKSPTYNPMKSKVNRDDLGRVRHVKGIRAKQYRDMGGVDWAETGERFPTDVIEFSNWNGVSFGNKKSDATKHPTQKPVDMLEYLINTFSISNDMILDNCMGSGSTGVACVNTGRNFIGIETKKEYFDYAENWINKAQQQMRLDL
jgi:site-specific DNA-methyltransferase (adenine-specific)